MQVDSPGTSPDAASPPTLPHGPHRLPRATVVASQRHRLLDAMAQAVAQQGYAATTVADVVSRAGVSRATFYEQFKNKEDCFLAAYDLGVELLLGEMARAFAEPGDWRDRLRRGIRTYLDVLAGEPEFAQTFLVEVLAAGPRARDRRTEVHRRFVALFEDLLQAFRDQTAGPIPAPNEVLLALVGGVGELVSEYLREGRAQDIPSLEPLIIFLALSIFAGPEEAAAELSDNGSSSEDRQPVGG